MIGASTRLLALLGNPVAHSLSPQIQNAGIRSLGLDGVYVALRCDSAEVAGLIRGIARGGGGGNVTLPHKGIAAEAVEGPSELVQRTGACNTFWMEEGVIRGENTDGVGLLGAVDSLLGRGPRGLRVLLVGAGGAARGALEALLAEGVGEVLLWNRTPERAVALASQLGEGRVHPISTLAEARRAPLDLVVQATSLGLREGDPLPFDPAALEQPGALLDLVYRPEETAVVHRARALGLRAADGGEMLVRQGAESFRLWWGVPAPLEAMRDALLGGRRPPEDAGVA